MDNDTSLRWNPEASASFWINCASKSLLRRQDERLRPLGFGMSQISIVRALADSSSASQKELADPAGSRSIVRRIWRFATFALCRNLPLFAAAKGQE